ncbi:MAG: TonB-dependent receptor [Solimonas sp.]
MRQGLWLVRLWLGACCAVGASLASAQEATPEVPDVAPFALGEVRVTAPGADTPQAGDSTLDQEDIARFDRQTVSRAVSLVPGVATGSVGARNEQALFVRGFDLRQVPVFVDGIPVYVSYDGYADMGRFTTFDLAQIQIAKGFSSVLFGPNTIGGAINLISRRPAARFEGDAGAGVDYDRDMADDGYRASFNLGSNQGTWYAQLSGSYLDRRHDTLSDDFTPTTGEDGGVRNNSYSTDKKLNLKLAWTPNATDEYSLNYIVQRGEKGNPPYAGDGSVSVRYWQWPHWDKDSLYYISKTAFGDAYVKVRAYYDTFRNSLFSYDDASYSTMTKGYAFKSWYDDYTYGGSVEAGTELAARNTLKASAHYKADFHREHDDGDPIQHFEDRTYSLGVEDTQRFGGRLDLVAGASYDWRDGARAEDYDSDTGLSDFARGDASSFNPQIGLFYKTSDTGNAYFTVARKSRFPTIKNRYSYSFGTSVPNPDLKAEYAVNYQLGVSQAWHGVQVDAAVYYSDITDMIQAVSVDAALCSDSATSCTQNQNVGKVWSKGAELGLHGRLLASLELGGNYTWLDRTNESRDPTVRAIQLTDVPKHKLFVYGQWDIAAALRFIASTEYDARRLSASDGSRVASGFAVTDFKLVYDVGGGLSVEAGARNVFDRNYAYTEGFYEEGRNYFSNVNYRFGAGA